MKQSSRVEQITDVISTLTRTSNKTDAVDALPKTLRSKQSLHRASRSQGRNLHNLLKSETLSGTKVIEFQVNLSAYI